MRRKRAEGSGLVGCQFVGEDDDFENAMHASDVEQESHARGWVEEANGSVSARGGFTE
jgi:hypothetical protein